MTSRSSEAINYTGNITSRSSEAINYLTGGETKYDLLTNDYSKTLESNDERASKRRREELEEEYTRNRIEELERRRHELLANIENKTRYNTTYDSNQNNTDLVGRIRNLEDRVTQLELNSPRESGEYGIHIPTDK